MGTVLLGKHLGAKSQGDAQHVLCSAKGTDHGRGLADSPHETWERGLMDKCSLRALATCSCWLAQAPTPLWRPPLDQSLHLNIRRGSRQRGAGQAGPQVWAVLYSYPPALPQGLKPAVQVRLASPNQSYLSHCPPLSQPLSGRAVPVKYVVLPPNPSRNKHSQKSNSAQGCYSPQADYISGKHLGSQKREP